MDPMPLYEGSWSFVLLLGDRIEILVFEFKFDQFWGHNIDFNMMSACLPILSQSAVMSECCTRDTASEPEPGEKQRPGPVTRGGL